MKKTNKKNRGFTLVELIVVLVILAILAAILVPALLGYIDNAKTKQNVLKAKNCLTATQAELSHRYAVRKDTDKSAMGSEVSSNSYGDMHVQGSDFAKSILKTADDDPYIFIAGVGHYDTYIKTDPHKAYTCYFAVYWADKNSEPLFFDGNDWRTDYPWKGTGQNTFNINGTDIKLQFYILKQSGANPFTELQNYLKNK